MVRFGRLRWRWIIGLVILTAGIIGGLVVWQTSRALKISRQEVRAVRELGFTLRSFSPPSDIHFETVRSPQMFAQVARFQDCLYVAGPAGLFKYDLRGNFLREFPAGEYLPSSPLVAMFVGRLAGETQPELILATADQGFLLFDGQNFRQLYPESADARGVTTVLPVASGHLLIGTKKRGVLLYDGKTLQDLHPTLSHLYVEALAGSEVDLWVGTLDQGVKHWHAGTTETFGEQEGLPDHQVLAVTLSGQKAYIGTPAGVAEFDDGRFSRVLASGILVTALHVQGDQLWIGSEDQGVVRVPLGTGHRHLGPQQTSNTGFAEVRQIQGTESGVMIVTRNGIFETNANGFDWREVLTPRPSVLTDRDVSALARDENGALWVGYFDRGLDILPDGSSRTVHIENEHVFCVNRIWPDVKGHTVEVATANGLVRFRSNGKPEQVLGVADGLIANHVTDVVPYEKGLAIATPAGITFLDADGARSMYAFHGLVNNHVYALGAADDELMVGTLGGLSSIHKGVVAANFTAGNSGLKQNWITAVVRVGDEWMIGTYGSGVIGLDDAGNFHTYETGTTAVEINPNAMLATKDHVFAGTLGDGLYLYDRRKERWTILTEGLPSTNVTSLTDGNGFVYIGTDNGLVRIEESKIQP